MSDIPATVETVVDQPMDFTIVARNPAEMVTAQRSMILWAARKIQAEKELLADAESNLATAKAHKWKQGSWAARCTMSRSKIKFYCKIKGALEAGYYIVPPFPLDVFAIRTARADPKHQCQYDYHGMNAERPDPLPEGEGRYVAATPLPGGKNDQTEYDAVKKEYVPTGRKIQYASYYEAVDFPFKLAKPAVLSETVRAMALKVFDQMGVMPRTAAADPMVLGQIISPKRNAPPVTFFVAWWLDTSTL